MTETRCRRCGHPPHADPCGRHTEDSTGKFLGTCVCPGESNLQSVSVLSRKEAEKALRGDHNFTALVSIHDSVGNPWSAQIKESRPLYGFRNFKGPKISAGFDDLSFPRDGYVEPTLEHVRELLDWYSDKHQHRTLVHCAAGISRSTAVALAFHVARLGVGHEVLALRLVWEDRRVACPNELIVKYADEILGCDGALVRAVEEIEHPLLLPTDPGRR